MKKSKYYLLLIALLIPALTMAQNTSKANELVATCAVGQWGNDYSICGLDASRKSGKGQLQKRKDEELVLVFDKKGTGYFTFYDCQSKKKYAQEIAFTYTVVNEQIRFKWIGQPETVKSIKATFNFVNQYRVRCTNDTLFFVDGLLKNSLYMNTNYFVRRK